MSESNAVGTNLPPGLNMTTDAEADATGGNGPAASSAPPSQLTARQVYSLLVFHGLKPEVAAPFLDFKVTGAMLQEGLTRAESLPEGFPSTLLAEAQVQHFVGKLWTSSEYDVRSSKSALENLPVCVTSTGDDDAAPRRVYVDSSGTILDVLNRAAQCQRPQGLLGALVDNRICSLQELIPKSRIRILKLEALSADTPFGRTIFKRSLKFLLSVALRRVFPNTVLQCEYALGGGIVCTVSEMEKKHDESGEYHASVLAKAATASSGNEGGGTPSLGSPGSFSPRSGHAASKKRLFSDPGPFSASPEALGRVEQEMYTLCKEALPFHFVKLSFEDALEYFREREQHHTLALLAAKDKNALTVPCVECDGNFMVVRNAPTVTNTRMLSPEYLGRPRPFRLVQVEGHPHDHSFSLWFSHNGKIGVPADASASEYDSKPLIRQTYEDRKTWGSKVRIAVQDVGSINNIIKSGASDTKELIQITEAMHDAQIVQIAAAIIKNPETKLVLIAGPSSSGKTTFATRLTFQLAALGAHPLLVSVDSYYKDWREISDKGPSSVDWESLDTLNLEMLNTHLLQFFDGKEVLVPEYDMSVCAPEPVDKWKKTVMSPGGVIVMEGIHCLNDRLTTQIPRSAKFKIVISPCSQLRLNNFEWVPNSTVRLLRRMVRDYLTRGRSGERTLKQWPSVVKGEYRNIFPHQSDADAVMNASNPYEVFVLKILAEPILKSISRQSPSFPEATTLLTFLEHFLPLSATRVPPQSLLREFVGGSWYYE